MDKISTKLKLNPTQKQVIKIILLSLIVLFVIVSVVIFSLLPKSDTNNTNNSSTSSAISSGLSTPTKPSINVEPWNVRSKDELFPFLSEEFKLYLDNSTNKIEAFSEVYNSVELEFKIRQWIENYNFLSFDEFFWEFNGKETLNEPFIVTPELEKSQLENL
jgi:uncharacterized protein YpmS